jgi:DNA-binding MarR family transcriptional regulator
MPSALGAVMNAILFGLKRAFQASIRFTRPMVAQFGLTAARFDMLYAIKQSSKCGMKQSDLRRTLGVTAPTVSRMLRSLEKLGLVLGARSRHGDARERFIYLTIAGLACIRRAIRFILRRRKVRIAFDIALTTGLPRTMELVETDNADSVCNRIRKGFGDTATLYYRWHPDD